MMASSAEAGPPRPPASWRDVFATLSARWLATPLSWGVCSGVSLFVGIRSLLDTPHSGLANLWMLISSTVSVWDEGGTAIAVFEEITVELSRWSWGSLFLHYDLLLFVFLWLLWVVEEFRALLGLRFGTWTFRWKRVSTSELPPPTVCSKEAAFECDTFMTLYEYAKMLFFTASGLLVFRLVLALAFAAIGIGCCAISAKRPFERAGIGGESRSPNHNESSRNFSDSVRSSLHSLWTYFFIFGTQFCASAIMYFFGYYHFGLTFPGGGRLPFDRTATVLVANHSHCMECIMLWSLAGAASFVSKRENLGIPGFAAVCEACDAVLVSRDSRSSRVECVEEIRRRARNHVEGVAESLLLNSKFRKDGESESELSTVSTAAATSSSGNPSPASATGVSASGCPRQTPQAPDSSGHRKSLPSKTSSDKQLLIFPEQTCSNHKCLLTFKKGAFMPGEPVQPVCVRYPYTYFNATMMRVRNRPLNELWIVLQTLCQFVNRVEIGVLPKYEPNEMEKNDPELFAENVRGLMGQYLELPLSDVGFDDVAEFVARQRGDVNLDVTENHSVSSAENRKVK